MTRLPIGAITTQTRENTTFSRGQGLNTVKHLLWRALGWNPAARGAHLVGATENNDLAFKVRFYFGSGHFYERSVGAGP